MSRTGHRARGEPVFSRSARRASGGEGGREKKLHKREKSDKTHSSMNVMDLASGWSVNHPKMYLYIFVNIPHDVISLFMKHQ